MIIIIHLTGQVLIYLVRFPPAYTRWSRSLYSYTVYVQTKLTKMQHLLLGEGVVVVLW